MESVRTQLFRVTVLAMALGTISWTAEAGQRRGSEDQGAAGQGQGQAVRRGSRADDGAGRRDAAPPPRAAAPAPEARRDEGVRNDRGNIRENRRNEGRAVPRRAPDRYDGRDRWDGRDNRGSRDDRWNGRDNRGFRDDRRNGRDSWGYRDDGWNGRDGRGYRRDDRWYGADRRYYRYAPPRVIVPRYAVPRRYYGPGGNFSVYFGWGSGYRFGQWYDGRVYGYAPPVVSYGTPRYYGDIRLRVRPRHAEVYVDGYYAGIVDNFDGVFQRLTVEAGRHEIEIVAPGYAPRLYEIYVDPTRTVELHGDLDGGPY